MFRLHGLQMVVAVAVLASGCERTPVTSAEADPDVTVAASDAAAVSLAGAAAQPLQAILGRGESGFVPKFLDSRTIGNSDIFEKDGRTIVGGTEASARLHVLTNFSGGGSSMMIEQIDPTGDIALDFAENGANIIGNIGIGRGRSGPPERFIILQNNPKNLPLTLAEEGGNVGIGTANPAGPLHVQTSAAPMILESAVPGSVLIDFWTQGELVGNLGVLLDATQPPERFFLLQNNPRNLPITLAEEGGNVGIGTVNPGSTLDVSGDANISGNLTVGGSKSSVATLADGRRVVLYAIESPQNWFEDFGRAQLERGEAWVPIEAVFVQTVNTADSYHVFLTPNGDCNGLYVAERRPDGFLVRELASGTSDVSFDYRIAAPRRGFETVRLQERP